MFLLFEGSNSIIFPLKSYSETYAFKKYTCYKYMGFKNKYKLYYHVLVYHIL